jgi:hypothetical protein
LLHNIPVKKLRGFGGKLGTELIEKMKIETGLMNQYSQ